MFAAPFSVNQRSPPVASVIPLGWGKVPGTAYWLSTCPVSETSAILPSNCSVIHRTLSVGSLTIPYGSAVIDGSLYSVTCPPVVIVPTESVPGSVNQRLLSGPNVMFTGDARDASGYSVTWPDGVITPIACCRYAANQRFPSGPTVMPSGNCPDVPVEAIGNSVIAPEGVIRPRLLPNSSVNQRLPSGPTVIPNGLAPEVGSLYSVIWPLEVIRPMLLETGSFSVNQRLPSGPATIWIRRARG